MCTSGMELLHTLVLEYNDLETNITSRDKDGDTSDTDQSENYLKTLDC